MLTTTNLTARALIWLATLAIPAQGLQVTACGCGGDAGDVQASPSEIPCCGKVDNALRSSCCGAEAVEEKSCCCARKPDSPRNSASESCCSPGTTCQCGAHCQCGTARAPAPTTPPVENTAAAKVTVYTTSAKSTVAICPSQAAPRYDHSATVFVSMAALERCISLCRFTL